MTEEAPSTASLTAYSSSITSMAHSGQALAPRAALLRKASGTTQASPAPTSALNPSFSE